MNNLLILCYQKHIDHGYWVVVPEEYYQDYIKNKINWGGKSSTNQLDLLESYIKNGFILASSLDQNLSKQTRKYEYDFQSYTYLQHLYNHFINNSSESYHNAIWETV